MRQHAGVVPSTLGAMLPRRAGEEECYPDGHERPWTATVCSHRVMSLLVIFTVLLHSPCV